MLTLFCIRIVSLTFIYVFTKCNLHARNVQRYVDVIFSGCFILFSRKNRLLVWRNNTKIHSQDTNCVFWSVCWIIKKKKKTPHGHGSNYPPFQTVHCLTIWLNGVKICSVKHVSVYYLRPLFQIRHYHRRGQLTNGHVLSQLWHQSALPLCNSDWQPTSR